MRVPGVELGTELCAALFVPREWWALIANIMRKWRHGMAGVNEFKDARDSEGEIGGSEKGRWENGSLLHNEILK